MILVTMRRGLSVFAALGMAVVAGACSSSTPPVHPEASSVATSSSGLVLGGRVRCTATMQTPVQAGHETGLTFALRNLTDHPVRVSVTPYSLWFVLKAADGTRYDTRVPFEGESMPGSIPSTIRPGRTKTVRQSDVRVRWAGPLSITPACEQTRLPRLRTNVAAAGPGPAERKAIADVAAASGHLLDRCGPSRAGVQVKGWIDPPSGNALPMRARCSIRLERQGRFVV